MEYHPNQYRVNARHATPRAAHTSMPMPDFTQAAKASAAMVDHADQLQNTLIEEIEYSSSLAEEQRISDLTTNALSEYQRRDNLTDGHPESWYDRNGIFRQAAFDAWESNYLTQIAATPTAGFIRPETKRKVTENAISTRNNLHKQLTAQQAASIPKHARRRLATSYENHMNKGDFASASRVVAEAPDWVMNQEDKDALIYEAQQAQNGDIIRLAYGSEQLSKLKNDPAFYNSLSTKHKVNLIDKLAAANRTEAAAIKAEKAERKAAEAERKAAAKEQKKIIDEAIRYSAMPSYVRQVYTKYDGSPADTLQGTRDAAAALNRYARDTITDPDDLSKREELRTLAKTLGLSESYATTTFDKIASELRGDESVPVSRVLNAIDDAVWTYKSPELYSAYNKKMQELEQKRAYARKRLTDEIDDDKREAFEENIEEVENEIRNLHSGIKANAEEARARILAKFDFWYDNGGKNKSLEMQMAAFNGFIIEETQSVDSKIIPSIKSAFEDFSKEKIKRFSEARKRKRDYIQREREVDIGEMEAKHGYLKEDFSSDVGYHSMPLSLKDSEKQPGSSSRMAIYVPKEMFATGTILKIRTADTEYKVECIEDDREDVVMSERLAETLGFDEETIPKGIFISNGYIEFEQNHFTDTYVNSLIPPPPDDGLVPINEYEYTDEEAMPASDIPLPIL